MSTETRVKPCPFCGGAAKEFERFNANVITCRGCGVKVRQSEMGEGDAAVRWNQRATPVAAQSQPEDDSIALDRLADYIADTWPMDKKYGVEEICQRLHAMWPGEFMPAFQVDKSTEAQGKQVDKPLDLQGHASVIFSKAVAWADARVDAALIQPEQDGYGSACDDAAQTHYELVLALRDLQQAQQPVSGADGLPPLPSAYNERGSYVGYGKSDLIAYARAALAQQDAMLDSRIAADMAAIVETLDEGEWAEHIAKTDLGQRLERHITQLVGNQQDADKVDAALAEMVHAMFRSGNSVPVTRITIDRKQYEATIDAAHKEQE